MNDFNIKRADFNLSIISQILRSDLCIPFNSSFLSKIVFFNPDSAIEKNHYFYALNPNA